MSRVAKGITIAELFAGTAMLTSIDPIDPAAVLPCCQHFDLTKLGDDLFRLVFLASHPVVLLRVRRHPQRWTSSMGSGQGMQGNGVNPDGLLHAGTLIGQLSEYLKDAPTAFCGFVRVASQQRPVTAMSPRPASVQIV
jgi:hypothetical protein